MFKKETLAERSWIMYDWANSVYATIIMAAVFPTFFAGIVADGDVWWSWGTSIATFTVALLAPILGAVADYEGRKKRYFTVFMLVGVVFSLLMAFGDSWQLMWIGYIISYIGFAGSCLFYDSFLTDVTTAERMDAVSAKGYAMGYIGGSTIPFLVSIAMIMLMDDGVLAVKLSVILTSVWWLLFSIPMLKNVKQTHSLGPVPKNMVAHTLRNVARTFKEIVADKAILLFILSYFFYIDGVNTVIHMSTAYGAALGLGTVGMILALLVTQLVAAPCAILFSRFSKKFGSIKMIAFAIIVYFVICVVGFYMGFSLEGEQQSYYDAFDSVYDTLDADTAAALNGLRDAGQNALAGDDFATEFGETADEYVNDADAAIRENVAAAVDKIEAAVTPVVTTDAFRAAYSSALTRSSVLFWAMAILVGTCQGGIQALSRSFFGKLIPPEKSNEYYGFFDIFGKFAAVIGPALYGLIKTVSGRSSFGILSLMLLFAIGGIILIIGRRHFSELETRSHSVAE